MNCYRCRLFGTSRMESWCCFCFWTPDCPCLCTSDCPANSWRCWLQRRWGYIRQAEVCANANMSYYQWCYQSTCTTAPGDLQLNTWAVGLLERSAAQLVRFARFLDSLQHSDNLLERKRYKSIQFMWDNQRRPRENEIWGVAEIVHLNSFSRENRT